MTGAALPAGPARPPLPKPSISLLIPALNEEEHIEAAVRTVQGAIAGLLADHEFILVDDGSSDRTGEIMDRLAREDPRIRVVHNPKNLGLGGAYKRGLAQARLDYVMWVSADNAETNDNLRNIIGHVGQADIIVPYLATQSNRPWFRRFTSKVFARLVNLLCGLSVRYYNGGVVHRRELIQGIDIVTDSFAYQAEALVKLLKAGRTYVEVGYESSKYSGVFSYALRPKNLVRVLWTVLRLGWWSRFGEGRRR
jgi:glycosyltransferase involved in cell wall biosynthesis